jgi:UDP-GlcNAc:undecaprenyl-phosphate GlcNAc-1-phosphate transferase
MSPLLPLATVALGTLLASALVPASRSLARRIGALDAPGPRRIHRTPTPRLGGVGVFATFALLALGGLLAVPPEWHRLPGNRLVALLAGASAAFGVGLLDDLLGDRFPVRLKLLGQLVAALILVVGGDVSTSFLPTPWLNALVAVLWIVGITNAFNLIDNMDGLSAGVALIASGILIVNAWLRGETAIVLILAAFMGSVAGFLRFNLRPGWVFLGDCGSHFIGYVMAAVTLLEGYGCQASSSLFPVLMPVVVLAVPIVDTVTVVVIRLREGRPIHVGDTRHLSHQLLSRGFSPRGALVVIYLLAASLGLAAFSLTDASAARSLTILLQVGGIVGVMLTLAFGMPAAGAAARARPVAGARAPASLSRRRPEQRTGIAA